MPGLWDFSRPWFRFEAPVLLWQSEVCGLAQYKLRVTAPRVLPLIGIIPNGTLNLWHIWGISQGQLIDVFLL
jgi:hypothetical protein